MHQLSSLPAIGGHLTLDFVNTAEERGHPQAGDVLQGPEDLRLWGISAGLLDGSRLAPQRGPAPEERLEFERAIAARELLYALLLARARDQPAPAGALAELARLTAESYAAAQIEQADDGRVDWRWSPARLESVRHVAVARSMELLVRPPDGRLKQCPGEHCGWLFLDATKRGNRRWCSMSECGQEAKDERRRARRAQRG